MIPVLRVRSYLAYAALALAFPSTFALGWAARTPAVPQPPAISALAGALPGASPGAGATTGCVDTAAMEANENLVAQLHEQRRARTAAEHAASEAEAKVAAAAKARVVPASVAPAREEWARMARDRTVRIRTPCASWKAGRRFGNGRMGVVSSSAEVRRRAAAAGLEEGELEALDAAYAAAHTRTWEAMRAACEEGPYFAAAIAESEVSNDADRVAICQASLLPSNDEGARGAIQRVAESRAAGKGVPGHSREERVAFALSESTDVLFEEMRHALGEEKAVRAIDFGVLCTNETMFVTAAAD